MPEICGYCGRIGHEMKDCSTVYLEDGLSSRRPEYGMWMAFNGRSLSIHRSTSTSPIGKNQMVLDSSSNPNRSGSKARGASTLTDLNLAGGSPTTGSGSHLMDISSAINEDVTVPVSDNLNPINAFNSAINVADFSKVKKKLDFGLGPLNAETVSKGKAIISESNHFFCFQSSGGDKKQPDLPVFPPVVLSGSMQDNEDKPAGFYSLSGWANGLNQFESKLGQVGFMKQQEWATSQAKPISELNVGPVTTSYSSKIGPNLKYWKRKARKGNTVANSSETHEKHKKRLAEGMVGGLLKRLRNEEDFPNSEETTMEAGDQSRREP